MAAALTRTHESVNPDGVNEIQYSVLLQPHDADRQ
jgi:hypothetical protein